MILKSFIQDNLVSFCIKINNLVIVVVIYYEFLITFFIKISYLFLLQAWGIKEGTKKKDISNNKFFYYGELMIFILIYYVTLHLSLSRPHTIVILDLLYLVLHFFWNNHKHFFLLQIYFQKFNV